MRWKIIIVNAGILFIVALLSYVLLQSRLASILSDPAGRKASVERALRAANAQLELDGVRVERWLSEQAARDDVRGAFLAGTSRARSDTATAVANQIREAAGKEALFAKMAPSLVLLVDAQGTALGRDGSNLLRGDKITGTYPSLTRTLKEGRALSDVWLNRAREEQMLASCAPVRDETNEIVGALVVGTPLNDERLTHTSELTSGGGLVVAVKTSGGAVEIIAKSDQTSAPALGLLQGERVKSAATASLGSRKLTVVEGGAKGYVLGSAPLSGYGTGSDAAVIAAVPVSLVDSVPGVLWPIFAVTALGVLLVVAGSIFLGNYIAEPISEMEEGLLQIINGKTDLRFEMEHPDLGGLIFRINSLLNALMGVPETDEEGRTSTTPDRPYQE